MFKSHPKGLYILFFTEMWERFSYYGMRAILSLYMINALFFDKAFTSSIYGYYTGLVYLTPLAGGYIADKFWGNRRSIIVGGVVMAIGQFALAASGYYYTPIADAATYATFSFNMQQILFLVGLTLLIVGNGFFKPNISTMVGTLYPAESIKMRDSAFTIFYMGINLGALLAPFIAGGLGDTGNPSDFKYGFLSAGIGMLLGLIVFIWGKGKYLVTPEGAPVGLVPERVSAEIQEKPKEPLSLVEKQRIAVIFILAFFVIFFWAAFEQAGVSLTFFAEEQTDRVISWLNNYLIPASFFQSINPIAIIIFAPIFAWIWTKLQGKGKEPNTPMKMALGLFLLSLGFVVLVIGSKIADTGAKVSPMWLIAAYTLHTFGELSLSPIGLSMVTKLSPVRFASLLMGVWFLANAAANWLAGMLSTLYPEPGQTTSILGFVISDLSSFFTIFVIMALIASAILFLLNKFLIKMMHGVT